MVVTVLLCYEIILFCIPLHCGLLGELAHLYVPDILIIANELT